MSALRAEVTALPHGQVWEYRKAPHDVLDRDDVLALIPEGSVLVTEERLTELLGSVDMGQWWRLLAAAAPESWHDTSRLAPDFARDLARSVLAALR